MPKWPILEQLALDPTEAMYTTHITDKGLACKICKKQNKTKTKANILYNSYKIKTVKRLEQELYKSEYANSQ